MPGPEWLTCELFSGRLGEQFEVGDPGVTLELVEALESSEPGGPGPEGQQRNQFSLVFRGPVEPLLRQETYELAHPELGDLTLFLVPIGRNDEGTKYEAAFA